ncbi:hypothetical protein J4467_03575 [Candidatus Woesearchaeota archaeon]|nr:hypothetical protein [Candidatus Woesearchaeota archaeon]
MMAGVKNLKAIGFDIDWTLYYPRENLQIPEQFCEAIAKELGLSYEEVLRFYKANKGQSVNSPAVIKRFSNERLSNQQI